VNNADTTHSASPTSSTISTSTNMASPNAAHKGNVGAIVGGVIGGTIVLFMMILLVWLILRQRRRIAMVATAAKPFVEEARTESFQPANPQEDRNVGVKRLPDLPPGGYSSMTCTSPSATSVSRSDDTTEDVHLPIIREREEGQRITIGSLIWELNELLRRRNHEAGEGEIPPAYTSSHV
jgi:hypothetical protein